jgi:hypothetical protein
MSYETTIGDIIISIDVVEDTIQFDIIEDHLEIKMIEDHIDVDIVLESFNIDIIEDVFSIDLVDDHIDVTIEGGCICPPSQGNGENPAVEIYSCDGTLDIGDLVYPSSALNKYVIKALDNNSPNPVIGIVTKIESINTVEVSHLGFFDVEEILEIGKKIFISANGSFTSNVMIENYLQVLGIAIGEKRVYLNPELRRCKRLSLIDGL